MGDNRFLEAKGVDTRSNTAAQKRVAKASARHKEVHDTLIKLTRAAEKLKKEVDKLGNNIEKSINQLKKVGSA